MNKKTHLLGFPTNWESKTLSILMPCESRYLCRILPLELRSRVLERLHRLHQQGFVIHDDKHLAALIHQVVRLILCDHDRSEARHFQRHQYMADMDCLADENGLPCDLQERLENLMGIASPLDAEEKTLLKTVLEDPNAFIVGDTVNQTALGHYLGVHQTTIRTRWLRIVEKITIMRGPKESLSVPEI